MDSDKVILKYHADWAQAQGRTTRKGLRVHIHPYDLISYVHKKDGIDKACELAIRLITKKYLKRLENSKVPLLPKQLAGRTLLR